MSPLFSKEKGTRKWISAGVAAFVAGLLTVAGIFGLGEYGIALFILIPLFTGVAPTILYGYNSPITKREAWDVSFLALGIYVVGLLLFALEGLICILMASPIAILMTWLGSWIGHGIVTKKPDRSSTVLLILLGSIPTLAFFESKTDPPLSAVTTSVEIEASPAVVWKNLVEFPQLKEPSELIFKTGIAYPINAKIEGTGAGAVRHCNFTTGSFVEPITVWDEPNLLKFDVLEQPAPLREISFWNVNAPHLHDYFVSKQGQFKLTVLPNGKTLLEGTTWYYHDIKPTFYWRFWSNYNVHKIHYRVLNHIKQNAESATNRLK